LPPDAWAKGTRLCIGVTGTRQELLASHPGAILRYGDAIGADAEA
jgi:hypothetical protein